MQTYQESIERVTIVGNITDRHKAREYCRELGFRIIHDTPRIISIHRIDPNQFKIVAEKEK